MTEAEWLACEDPELMLRTLHARRHPTGRKLRLFICACCRHVPSFIRTDNGLAAVDVVERYADGLATGAELSRAINQAFAWGYGRVRLTPSWVMSVRSHLAADSADGISERCYQVDLLRDIFRTPHRSPVADPVWLTSTVVSLAAGIYADRAFDRLPILADALQDAGCEDAAVLDHCRGPGPHARGCWVVDMLLGKS